MSASGVAIPKTREIDRRRWRSVALIAAILASFAAGAAARTAVSAAKQDVPGELMSRPGAAVEPRGSIHAPRQETIVSGIAEAERAGCSVVLKMGGALLEDGFEFRRATRVLAHQLMAHQNLDRVTSRVTRVDDRLTGVVYGERCP